MANSSDGDALDYSIHSCSSFSGDFTPEKILTDNPSDPKSRWLSCDNRLPQFVILKLHQPSIVSSIQFGKYDKSHPCNLRKFRVYGGMNPDRLHLLLEDGLSNDPVPETFSLHFQQKQDVFPCQYIKIAPFQSWGYSFNFSIWYVSLCGSVDKTKVSAAVDKFRGHCEHEAVRICLKHLRENDYSEAFQALQKKAKVSLEHPLLSRLHGLLVVKGDFLAAEQLIEEAAADGHLGGYIAEQPINAQWKQLHPKDQAGERVSGGPVGRGGHQMCLDLTSQTIYLHGGWDGANDLSDLWSYDIERGVWTCICQDTSLVGGPSARSCHKMCLDSEEGVLYLLGQYFEQSTSALIDLSTDADEPVNADFYSYSISKGSWTLLSSDTYRDYGPKLIFDHQMCFDEGTKTMYVFGGRILSDFITGRGSGVRYSGLYAYFVTEKQWVCIQPDLITQPYSYALVPRMAHSMLLDSENRLLYVLGGQRGKDQLSWLIHTPHSDMVMYDLQSDITTVLADGVASQIPASGFTVRTALKSDKSEICLFASLSQLEEKESRQVSKSAFNSLWTYHFKTASWKCVSQGDQSCATHPLPRYAHQFLYNHSKDVYYMFGGNPGPPSKSLPSSMRMDDFWELKLVSLSKEELVRQCRYAIRKQQFSELTAKSPVEAISYLRVQLAGLVDHGNTRESTEFRELASALFKPMSEEIMACNRERSFSTQRYCLYNQLSSYFPYHMTQPRQNITDLVEL
ncbi:muskelin-like [Halichondria panicea]|uniref:muskelin-like n=1 Tax=Halichondria panicea TaxID=6063 RepID=UPI00312B505D